MTAQPNNDLTSRLHALDAHQAWRVARLVFECQASLYDALAAIEDADRQAGTMALSSDAGAANERRTR